MTKMENMRDKLLEHLEAASSEGVEHVSIRRGEGCTVHYDERSVESTDVGNYVGFFLQIKFLEGEKAYSKGSCCNGFKTILDNRKDFWRACYSEGRVDLHRERLW